MFDPFEYLVNAQQDGLLNRDFRHRWQVSYHVPCHLRVQNMGQKTRECSNSSADRRKHGGALRGPRWHLGRKSEFFADSMKSAGRIPQMASTAPTT